MSYRRPDRKPLAMLRTANGGGDLAFQLVDGNCQFNNMGMNDFEWKVNLSQCGRSYAVVAIMGPQSSGKSTLLNHLFRTNFKEMNESVGRSQTTNGIWLARCPDIEPLTLVMDMEGTDGSERGEDTAFENRSALFALAVADVVLINMWYKDIGLNNAANKPLLRIVFQQVMFRFSDKQRKITLMFVVRDKPKNPPDETLEAKLKDEIQEIWTSIRKPPERNNIQLSDFFKVEVIFLPHYEYRLDDFKVEVQKLKQRFVNSTEQGGLVGNQKESASGFSTSAKLLWEEIMANKNLDLPKHKVVVATSRCEQIKNDKYYAFQNDEEWCKLCKDAESSFIPGFGKIVNLILNTYLSQYDKEAAYFDEATTKAKRKELVDKLLQVIAMAKMSQKTGGGALVLCILRSSFWPNVLVAVVANDKVMLVQPKYEDILNHLVDKHFEKFMEAFDEYHSVEHETADSHLVKNCLVAFDKDSRGVRIERAKWDNLKARTKFERKMYSYIFTKNNEDKVDSKIRQHFEPKLKRKLSSSVKRLLCKETDPTWEKIRSCFIKEMNSTLSKLDETFSKFDIDEESRKEKFERIVVFAIDVVEAKAREESGRAKYHMRKKFVELFMHGSNSSQHDWQSQVEIQNAAGAALLTPLKVLAGLVAIRLQDHGADNIENILLSGLLYSSGPNTSNPLDSLYWEEVPSSRTLIRPIDCKQLWEEYLVGVDKIVKKAVNDLEKKRPRWLRFVLNILDVIISIPSGIRRWAERNF